MFVALAPTLPSLLRIISTTDSSDTINKKLHNLPATAINCNAGMCMLSAVVRVTNLLWEGLEVYAVTHLMHQYALPGATGCKGQPGGGHHAGLPVYGCKGVARPAHDSMG